MEEKDIMKNLGDIGFAISLKNYKSILEVMKETTKKDYIKLNEYIVKELEGVNKKLNDPIYMKQYNLGRIVAEHASRL